jgi:hypothetical protein
MSALPGGYRNNNGNFNNMGNNANFWSSTEYSSNKIYLQHFSKGVKYLGSVIKPHRIYIANRTRGNFYATIEKQNQIVRDHKPIREEQEKFLSSMNSYLGIMKHYKSYNLRKRMLFKNLSAWWWNYTYLSG